MPLACRRPVARRSAPGGDRRSRDRPDRADPSRMSVATVSWVPSGAVRTVQGYPSRAMTARDLIDLAPSIEKAFLVAVDTGSDDGGTAEDSLTELANLATTAGARGGGAGREEPRGGGPQREFAGGEG